VKRLAAIVGAALLTGAAPAWSQTLYKCTTARGAVSYQEVPCAVTAEQKRLANKFATTTDAGVRRALEEDAAGGDPLARDFLGEVRERERLEREERLRREREKPPAPVVESTEWMPPWGWSGPPGLARPKPTPVK
jgi:hypothetical protein